jgi:hypothetical protein
VVGADTDGGAEKGANAGAGTKDRGRARAERAHAEVEIEVGVERGVGAETKSGPVAVAEAEAGGVVEGHSGAVFEAGSTAAGSSSLGTGDEVLRQVWDRAAMWRV